MANLSKQDFPFISVSFKPPHFSKTLWKFLLLFPPFWSFHFGGYQIGRKKGWVSFSDKGKADPWKANASFQNDDPRPRRRRCRRKRPKRWKSGALIFIRITEDTLNTIQRSKQTTNPCFQNLSIATLIYGLVFWHIVVRFWGGVGDCCCLFAELSYVRMNVRHSLESNSSFLLSLTMHLNSN